MTTQNTFNRLKRGRVFLLTRDPKPQAFRTAPTECWRKHSSTEIARQRHATAESDTPRDAESDVVLAAGECQRLSRAGA